MTAPSSKSIPLQGLYSWQLSHALRLHNWLKNILLFVPAIVAQDLGPAALSTLCLALLAFGCTASAHYLLNDFLDRDDDRQVPAKRERPQAAGLLPRRQAFALGMVLIAIAASCASWLPIGFQLTLAAYLFLCVAYSLLLKRVPMIDVLVLVLLLDLRLAAGASAAMVPLPNALLLACTCFLLAMALFKRLAQIAATTDNLAGRLPGRPYSRSNLPTLRALAGAAGVMSVAACAIFLDDHGTQVARPGLLWFMLPILAASLRRCFIIADRGKLNEDIVLFVLADHPSLMTLAALALLLIAAG